jgi:Carboxypeptidase regulatory-like domain
MAAASGLLLALVTLVNPPALHAQAVSIASVTGRVVDGQGALVTGAQLRMTGVDTGAVYNTVTNADGIYNFPSLPIGAYTLESTVPGFQTSAQRGIVLRVNDHVEIDVTMKVGAVAERVEVTANAGLVQTQQNTISQVVDQQRIVDLPLDGREATQLITISGASVNHSDGTNTGSKSFFSSQSISIAGTRATPPITCWTVETITTVSPTSTCRSRFPMRWRNLVWRRSRCPHATVCTRGAWSMR